MTILAFIVVALGSFVAGAVWRGMSIVYPNRQDVMRALRTIERDSCTKAWTDEAP